MPNPTAAMLVIGDEILSGRTRDSNLNHLAIRLTEQGIDLCEARVVGDTPSAIVAAVRELSARYDHLFTSGGIGPTHDDITADCVAKAMGAPIGVRDDARALLVAHYESRGTEFNEDRQRMARIPDGATLIDNPVSVAPGFTLGNVHVMAGVPRVFEAMVAGLLPKLAHGAPTTSASVRLRLPEGDLAGPLRALAAAHPHLSFGSYPRFEDNDRTVAIVVRGADAEAVAAIEAQLRDTFAGDIVE